MLYCVLEIVLWGEWRILCFLLTREKIPFLMIAYSHFNQLSTSMFMIILSSREMKRTLEEMSVEKNDEPHVSHRDRQEKYQSVHV